MERPASGWWNGSGIGIAAGCAGKGFAVMHVRGYGRSAGGWWGRVNGAKGGGKSVTACKGEV